MRFLSRLFWLLVVLVVAAQAAVLYLGYERHRALEADVARLNGQVERLQSQLEAQKTQLEAMEDESVSAMVERANEVIVGGWDAIVQSVEKEMTRARQALEQLDRQDTAGSAQTGPDTTGKD